VVFSGDCSTVRQPSVEEVNNGQGDAYYVEFCQRADRLLYLIVLERMGSLVGKIVISYCAAGTR